MRKATFFTLASRGFSLIELAIVLFIITLLMGGLLPTITSQLDQQRTNETRKQLDDIQQALIGYAVNNGRLPCPAITTSYGVEDPPGGGTCTNPYDGFVPAATLGVPTGVDNQGNKGFAVDAWGNRIRYAVTTWSINTFTTTGSMKANFSTPLAPNLIVCSTASTTSTGCSVANSSLTSLPGIPAVIFSTGKNGASGGTGADEAENLTKVDRIFVSHIPTTSSAANGEFDDLVVWLSPNILINRMVTAGVLP